MDAMSRPLSPMLVQYLVGLCCLRWDPDAVDVTLGDMVLDTAAGRDRDVDVTVTVAESGHTTHAFKAYEVKREGAPLDVGKVEQLCVKLLDMPTVTHRAIVSASGFTAGAEAKAAHHGVQLFVLRPWTRPLQEQFPLLTMKGTAEECIPMRMWLLWWLQPQLSLVSRAAKCGFVVQPTDRMLDSRGNLHSEYSTFAAYREDLLLRSTEILFPLEPAATVARTLPDPRSAAEGVTLAGPAWQHTHTMDVGQDDVHVTTEYGLCRLDVVTISGHLQWQCSDEKVKYFVIESVPGGEAFAGAIISLGARDGNMTGLVLSPKTREIGIHMVRLADKHKNAIRRLTLDLPRSAPAS